MTRTQSSMRSSVPVRRVVRQLRDLGDGNDVARPGQPIDRIVLRKLARAIVFGALVVWRTRRQRPRDAPYVDRCCTGGSQGARQRPRRAARGHDVVDHCDALSAQSLGTRKGLGEIRATLNRAQPHLRGRIANPGRCAFEKGAADGSRHPAPDLGRLIESALGMPIWVQWHRHDHVYVQMQAALHERRAEQRSENPPGGQLTSILERMNQAVQWRRVFEGREAAAVRRRLDQALTASDVRLHRGEYRQSAADTSGGQHGKVVAAGAAEVQARRLARPAAQNTARRQQQAADAIENGVNR